MFIIENVADGTYEFKAPDVDGYQTPIINTYNHNGTTSKVIDVEYEKTVKPIEIESGLADITINIKNSTNTGQTVIANSDLQNSIRFTNYDYTNDIYKIQSLNIIPESVPLKSFGVPATLQQVNSYFKNIKSGYYYIFQIAEVPGYSTDETIFYQNIKDDKSYTKDIIFNKTISDKICFEVPINVDGITELDPFNLEIATGFNKSQVEFNSVYTTINFSGSITDFGSRKGFLSGVYSISDVFGTNYVGWIKVKNKIITNDDITFTVLETPLNCSEGIENRVISTISTNVKKLSITITSI